MSKVVKIVAPKGVEAVAPKERDGEKFGKKSGLRITHFVNALLAGNRSAQLGDDALQSQLADEFPKRKSLQAMSAYRSYFNAGKHGHGDGKSKSVSYERATQEGREANTRKDKNHPLAGSSPAKGRKPAKKKKAAPKSKGRAGSKVVGKKRPKKKAAK